jgi:hypothetical protein
MSEFNKNFNYIDKDMHNQIVTDKKQEIKFLQTKITKQNEIIEKLESSITLKDASYLHNYFRGVVSDTNSDYIQSKEDQDLFAITLRLETALKLLKKSKNYGVNCE